MKKTKTEKPLTRAKAKVRIQKTQKNSALMDLKRQLSIEASLDRVRKKALSMKKPDDLLNICKTFYTELQLLGFDELRNSIINIHNDDNESIVNYDCAKTGASINHFTYHVHPLIESLVRQMKSGRAAFSEGVLSGKKLKEFFKAFRKSHGEKIEAEIRNAKALYYYFYSTGTGALGISNLAPLDPGQLKILKRFRNVFDLAYRRYADIQKAVAQAREAQIEAALEKVRSRSLAMHRSDELREVVKAVFDKLQDLNFVLEDGAVSILIFKGHSRDHTQWIADPGHSYATPFELDYSDHSIPRDVFNARESGRDYFSKIYPVKEKNEYFKYLFAHSSYKYLPIEVKELILGSTEYGFSAAFTKHAAIVVPTNSGRLLNETEKEILKRFVRVFEQSFTRFLDLQKAEAQAREAQIEAALERVRSRAMGMRTSEELNELIGAVFTELTKLDFSLTRCVIIIYDSATNDSRWWMANSEDSHHPMNFLVQDHDHEPHQGYIHAWKKQKIKWTYELKGDVKKNWDDFLFSKTELSHLPDFVIAGMREPERVYLNASFNTFGNLTLATLEPLSDQHFEIMLRFAKVFGLTYTRFNDLKQAEAQAREAKIEAALERVRSRTMAMQNSDELADVAGLMFQQVRELGFSAWTTGFNVWSDDNNTYTDYVTSPLGGFIEPYTIDATLFPSFKEISDAKKSGQEFYVQYLEGEVLKETYLELSKFGDKGQYVKMREGGFEFPTRQFDHFVFLSNISLMFITYDPVPEAHELFKRFGKVFEQTYTRFLDLQKAEAQAREAQIEAALENVRSRSLAMHYSEELKEVVVTIFEKLKELGLVFDGGAGVKIFSEGSKDSVLWVAVSDTMSLPPSRVNLPYVEDIFLRNAMHVDIWKARETNTHLFNKTYSLEEKNEYFNYVFAHNDYIAAPQSMRDYIIQTQSYTGSEAYEKNTAVVVSSFSEELISEKQFEILRRFSKVFEQAYTRFLDLQKAEGQARESKIEASLERVRGKAMAMHSSADLAATIGIFYRELESFSITPRRCGVGLLDKETRVAELSTMNTTDKGNSIEIVGKLKMQGHPVLEGVYDNWILQREYHPVLRGNEIKKYYQLVRPQISFPEYPNDAVQYGYFFFFPEGGVYSWTENELAEDELKIYRRFTSVLSLTYKRYKDLKDAETLAKEAVKQATLDRVRAEIASMRTKLDLDRITPLIWNELTILGIPFVRCGVFIMDDKHQLVHTFLSTPDGKAIGAFHLAYENSNLKEAIRHWHDNQVYVTHWGEKEFGEMAATLLRQGSIASLDQYLKPTEGIHLHFVPFLQGMLYVGNTTRLQEDDIHLLQSLAEAFSTAYARYEDFNKLEAAKQQVEKTLMHLRQAQQQLVQSEKMASLGELTAGIAHEIQNPLNFVNNFSEVSNELIDEMVEEVKKGNFDEAKIIANDLKQNLEKINHHGKRADGIVKSMLQHSRSSSGQKELTDINVLCDEYLRLSYHGLRAKDKSFNAKFETNFDSTLEKINVIPQDIGRVILNLINNAFYAVTEKRNDNLDGYEPTILVSTKQLDDKVELTVKDNGNGIPQKVLDKIFQPFFTTKPPGQGTGLGLSLSYDIVKSHGGELKVETEQGVGTEFSFQLPISS